MNEPLLKQAFEDWNSNDIYVTTTNIYRSKSQGKVVSWNRWIKNLFYNNDHFHKAAQQYQKTGDAKVPPYLVLENVRITRYSERISVEVQSFPGNAEMWDRVWGYAAVCIFEGVRPNAPEHPVFQGECHDNLFLK